MPCLTSPPCLAGAKGWRCRRQSPEPQPSGPVHLVVDSTGLKAFGEGEWLENKHKTKAKRKRWRKLHLGLNLVVRLFVSIRRRPRGL
ncbi:transposase [Sinorhizobium medicae]